MNWNEFKSEFFEVLEKYNKECDDNYGHEGTVLSLYFSAQLKILHDLGKKYYGYNLIFERRI